MSEIVPVMMTNLPLKEDKDEYEMVFKALTVLYSAGRKILFWTGIELGRLFLRGGECFKGPKQLDIFKVLLNDSIRKRL